MCRDHKVLRCIWEIVLPSERMRAGWLDSFSSGVKITSSISRTLERGDGHKSRRTGLRVVKLTVSEPRHDIDDDCWAKLGLI